MKSEEMKEFTEVNQNDTTICGSDPFEQIELKIEKDDMVGKEIFFNTPIQRNKSRRIGNTWGFLFDSTGNPRIVIGPHCKCIISPI
jgi:hypothetical protein